jgi:hypothetical protein
MIRKDKTGWTVVSHKTGKSLGHYKTEKEVKKRLAQILYFKHLRGSK